jgi:hypothetical protein
MKSLVDVRMGRDRDVNKLHEQTAERGIFQAEAGWFYKIKYLGNLVQLKVTSEFIGTPTPTELSETSSVGVGAPPMNSEVISVGGVQYGCGRITPRTF